LKENLGIAQRKRVTRGMSPKDRQVLIQDHGSRRYAPRWQSQRMQITVRVDYARRVWRPTDTIPVHPLEQSQPVSTAHVGLQPSSLFPLVSSPVSDASTLPSPQIDGALCSLSPSSPQLKSSIVKLRRLRYLTSRDFTGLGRELFIL